MFGPSTAIHMKNDELYTNHTYCQGEQNKQFNRSIFLWCCCCFSNEITISAGRSSAPRQTDTHTHAFTTRQTNEQNHTLLLRVKWARRRCRRRHRRRYCAKAWIEIYCKQKTEQPELAVSIRHIPCFINWREWASYDVQGTSVENIICELRGNYLLCGVQAWVPSLLHKRCSVLVSLTSHRTPWKSFGFSNMNDFSAVNLIHSHFSVSLCRRTHDSSQNIEYKINRCL